MVTREHSVTPPTLARRSAVRWGQRRASRVTVATDAGVHRMLTAVRRGHAAATASRPTAVNSSHHGTDSSRN